MSSILAQVLPGVRSMRTPICVAALWVLAALTYRAQANEQLRVRIDHGIEDIVAGYEPHSLSAVSIFGGFALYLLGVLLDQLGQTVSAIVKALLWVSLPSFLLFLAADSMGVWSAVPIVILLALIVLFRLKIWAFFQKSLRVFVAVYDQNRSNIWKTILSQLGQVFSSERQAILFMATEELKRQMGERSELLDELVNQLHPLDILAMLAETETDLSELVEDSVPVDGCQIVENDDCGGLGVDYDVVKERVSSDDTIVVEGLRKILRSRLNDPHYRNDIVREKMYLGEIVPVMENVFHELAVSLQANHSEVYQEYDRLVAEAEFRKAVALPLAVFSLLFSRLFWGLWEYAETVSWVIALLTWLVFVWSSRNQREVANRRLWAAYRLKLVPTIPMRDIKASEVVRLRISTDALRQIWKGAVTN